MEITEFSLNLNNIKLLPFDKYEHNFTFIVNNKRYETNRIIADLLSPIIRNYHYSDSTISEYSINIRSESTLDEPENDDYFQDFLNLCKSSPIKIDETRKKYFIQYFFQLGNINEYLELQPELFDQLSSENMIDRINILIESTKNENNISNETEISFYGNNFEKLIEFASSHFHEIDKEKLAKIDKTIIEEIISNESLQIEDESELMEFVLYLYEKDQKYSNLFEYIEFEYVNDESIEKFIEQFSINDLSLGTWKSICKKLHPVKNDDQKSKRYLKPKNIIEKVHVEGQEFQGILRYLSEKSGGNIHDKGIVEITSNSIYSNDTNPKYVVDYDKNNCYETSLNVENAKLCFDFKQNKIQTSQYSIKTSASGNHLKSWVIEASNDGKNWKIIDKHENDSALNKNDAIVTFNINKADSFYRFIQLRQIGKSWNNNNNYDAVIYYFEFYGKLKIAK